MLQSVFDKLFGSYNERQLKTLRETLPKIHAKSAEYKTLTDKQLQDKFAQWKEILTAEPNKTDDLMVEVFAGIQDAARRLCGKEFEVRGKMETWNMVHYDVQLIGGMVLHSGKIGEMKTGEGKTLVCTLPVILNALTGKGVHVVTVNEYLSTRDAEWMKPLYEFCGLTVGVNINELSHDEKREAYQCDITYGTNNEFGFDYLRDNMAQSLKGMVQRPLYFSIVDEVDSILIDEARTPLIISAPAEQSTEKYMRYSQLIPQLQQGEDYEIELKSKTVTLTEPGITKLEKLLGVENIYTESGFEEVHHIEQSLKAHVIFQKDKDYVVRDGEILIVDEFTGRMMSGRRYSDGLHQALEAKERVEIQRESKTLATITFQNYFRLYEKLSGMTGTAETEAEEFAKIYKLDTIVIPTNRPIARIDLKDKIFKNEKGKFIALARSVKELNEKGQPVLVGTVSIEKSEALSALLKGVGIKHEVLNAKQHEREAEIVANAGKKGAVTIATNMAGRGTDIKISDEVKELGGLAILGTERHESRRIDNQLRGRAGRQGDPGFSQFYVAMTDELMRRFGGARMAGLMDKLGIPEDEAIENSQISRTVEGAQKRIEGFHFDARKHVVQYDDVMNIHREKIYTKRATILQSDDITQEIQTMMEELVHHLVAQYTPTLESDSLWDIPGLSTALHAINQTSTEKLPIPKLEKIYLQSEIKEKLMEFLYDAWQDKKSEFDDEQIHKVTRFVVLKSIDDLWLNHIDAMTHLRDRVALSGYAQKDPVMEYKREAFDMFQRLLLDIRTNAITNLYRVHLQSSQKLQAADYSHVQTNADAISEGLRNTGEYDQKQIQGQARGPKRMPSHSGKAGQSVTAEKLGTKFANVGRNETCPCGSGKKFKQCHGKNL